MVVTITASQVDAKKLEAVEAFLSEFLRRVKREPGIVEIVHNVQHDHKVHAPQRTRSLTPSRRDAEVDRSQQTFHHHGAGLRSLAERFALAGIEEPASLVQCERAEA